MDDSEGFTMEEKKPPNSILVSSNGVNYRSNKIWPTFKPFVNGFLAGQLTLLQAYCAYWSVKLLLPLVEDVNNRHEVAKIRSTLHAFRKVLPRWVIFQATYATAQFGSFEFLLHVYSILCFLNTSFCCNLQLLIRLRNAILVISILTKEVEAENGGLRLTLYQEACCGLISGGIAGSIWHPLNLAAASLRASSSQSVETQFNYRNLWKGSGFYVSRQMVMNMGLLTSYSQSVGYFSESVGLTKSHAQLGAGIVSAFFAAACTCPWPHIAAIKDVIQADGGRKYSYRHALFCLWQVFRPGGQFKIYSGIFSSFLRFTPYFVMQWLNLEGIRPMEEERGL